MYDKVDDRLYIVLEYCHGGSLDAVLRHSGPVRSPPHFSSLNLAPRLFNLRAQALRPGPLPPSLLFSQLSLTPPLSLNSRTSDTQPRHPGPVRPTPLFLPQLSPHAPCFPQLPLLRHSGTPIRSAPRLF